MNPRHAADPQPGFFRMRVVKGGPLVGAEIKHCGKLWEAWINGRMIRPPHEDASLAGVYRIWLIADPVEEPEFRYLIDDREWFACHEPTAPEARPGHPVNLSKQPADYFRPLSRE